MNQPPIPYRDDNGISFGEKATRGRSGVAKSLWLFWALLGPGIITQLANNDAGGTISYAMTGAAFGISLFLLSLPKTSSRAKDWAATWFSLEWERQREVCD